MADRKHDYLHRKEIWPKRGGKKKNREKVWKVKDYLSAKHVSSPLCEYFLKDMRHCANLSS